MSPVTAAVIREPLHRMRGLLIVKTPLDALEHQITDHLAEMPSVVATQDITSRSQVSSAKATRALCPFQQATSKPSDVQRRFGRIVMI